jgi:hypothetical protein
LTPYSVTTTYKYFEGLFCPHFKLQNKWGEGMSIVYRHTARTVVTQIRGREKAEEMWSEPATVLSRKYDSSRRREKGEEMRSEPATVLSRKYESSRGQTEFSSQRLLP